jgi:hypothetical protein
MKGRRLVAAVFGFVAGGAAFLLLLGAGLLVYQRLWTGSGLFLAGIELLFGAAGAYAGWLIGIIVFSALRGQSDGAVDAR